MSYPLLDNNVFWQNRAFYIGVGALSATYQQHIVTLYNAFTTMAAPPQPQTFATAANPNGGLTITGGTGACVPATTRYWDIGVRGDTGPGNHSSGFTLAPTYSLLTNTGAISENGAGSNNLLGSNPSVISQYCNGSRIPPELTAAGAGWQVPPGIADATVPNPPFSLAPAATVDEGNNWVNMSWGPLAETNPVTGVTLGNYGLAAAASPAVNHIPSTAGAPYTIAPATDFYGTLRKTNGFVDAGAVEFAGSVGAAGASVTGGPLAFGDVAVGATSTAQTLTLHNTGTANLAGITVVVPAPFARAGGTCGATLSAAAPATCTITVVFSPTAAGATTGSVTINANAPVTGSPVPLSGTGTAATRSATVTPNPLAFGNQRIGTTSNAEILTVTNTGKVALAGGAFTFGGGTPQPFSRVNTGVFPAGAPNCGTGLALGASCSIKVVFAPATAATFSRTLTVAYTGATVTPAPVALTGTGVGAGGAVIISPLAITLPTGVNTGTGTVTLTNAGAAGSAPVLVRNVAVAGGSGATYVFTTAGANTCTGAAIKRGANCTVRVRFTNVGSTRGTDRAGTITFTDTATGSPQVGALVGRANP